MQRVKGRQKKERDWEREKELHRSRGNIYQAYKYLNIDHTFAGDKKYSQSMKDHEISYTGENTTGIDRLNVRRLNSGRGGIKKFKNLKISRREGK